MRSRIRSLALTALCLGALSATAGAQALATYGSLEAAGYGEGSAYLGATIGTGRLGLQPVASVGLQTYRYRNGSGHDQASSISPALGAEYKTTTGNVQGQVGYSFVSGGAPTNVLGLQGGSVNSPFVTLQGNHWGDGSMTEQAIVSYATRSEYTWARLRAARRIQMEKPIYAGAEVVGQGSSLTPHTFRLEVGPTIEYRPSPAVHLGAAAGFRGPSSGTGASGYAKLEFLYLTSLGGM